MEVAIIIPIVISLVVIVATVVPAIFIFKKVLGGQAGNAKLRAQGESAQAQIQSVQETGVRLNDRPQVQITFYVQRAGQAPYQAQSVDVISSLIIPRVQPGMTVPVRVDPANPQNVALDMAALQSAPMGGGMMMGAQAPGPYGGQGGYGAPGAYGAQGAAAYGANAAAAAGHAQAAHAGAYAAHQANAAQQAFNQQAAQAGYNPQAVAAQAAAGAPMAGVNPYGMSQDQLMALANQAAAMPPAGGAIINCGQCRMPYASANPRCPNCGQPKP